MEGPQNREDGIGKGFSLEHPAPDRKRVVITRNQAPLRPASRPQQQRETFTLESETLNSLPETKRNEIIALFKSTLKNDRRVRLSNSESGSLDIINITRVRMAEAIRFINEQMEYADLQLAIKGNFITYSKGEAINVHKEDRGLRE